MNKLRRFNKKILMSTVALILAATAFIASVCYAWFVIGLHSKTNNTYTQVVGDGLAFGSTITAVKHYTVVSDTSSTAKKEVTDSYYVSAGQIRLSEGSDKDESSNPFFNALMPGDYVDITFSVYAIDEKYVNKSFTVYLTDFATDDDGTETNAKRSYSFRLAKSTTDEETDKTTTTYLTTVYGVLGVFKWGLIKTTVYNNGEASTPTESETMQYFHEEYKTANSCDNIFDYYEDGGTDKEYRLEIARGTFTGTGIANKIEFTIRIQVDTDELIDLIDKYGAIDYDVNESEYYLNSIILQIGRIVLSAVDNDSSSTED